MNRLNDYVNKMYEYNSFVELLSSCKRDVNINDLKKGQIVNIYNEFEFCDGATAIVTEFNGETLKMSLISSEEEEIKDLIKGIINNTFNKSHLKIEEYDTSILRQHETSVDVLCAIDGRFLDHDGYVELKKEVILHKLEKVYGRYDSFIDENKNSISQSDMLMKMSMRIGDVILAKGGKLLVVVGLSYNYRNPLFNKVQLAPFKLMDVENMATGCYVPPASTTKTVDAEHVKDVAYDYVGNISPEA